MVASVLCTWACIVTVRVNSPLSSAVNPSNRPPACESQVGPSGAASAAHWAMPSTAFGVKPEPWTTTCSPSAYGPIGVVLMTGGGATAVGSKPSGTSVTASGSSTDWTRTTHSPTASAQFAVSAKKTTPSAYVSVRCTRKAVSTLPSASAVRMSGKVSEHENANAGRRRRTARRQRLPRARIPRRARVRPRGRPRRTADRP